MSHFLALPVLLTCVVGAAAQSPFLSTRHAALATLNGSLCCARGDLDNDGDIDLVVANDYPASQILLNDGNGRLVDATAGRLVSPANNDAHAIALADLDGDEDLDLVVGQEDFGGNRVYLNNGAAVFTDVTSTALPAVTFDTKNLVLADFDGDGDVDILTVDWPACHYYANNGTAVFTDVSATRLVGLGTYLGHEWLPAAEAADFDGDGDLDVVLEGGGLLQNQGGVLSPFPNQLSGMSSAPHWLADVDGDGDLDVFAGGGRSLHQNQGNATFVNVTATAFNIAPIGGLAILDVDLDGDVDLLTTTRMFLNSGTGQFTSASAATSFPYGVAVSAMVADFDGDGDIDLPGKPNLLRHVNTPTQPQLGGTYSLEIHARQGAAPMAAAFAALAPGAVPSPFGLLRLDPASFVTLTVQPVPTSPLVLTWTLPNVPALTGTNLHYQAIVDDPFTGPSITNAIRDVVQ